MRACADSHTPSPPSGTPVAMAVAGGAHSLPSAQRLHEFAPHVCANTHALIRQPSFRPHQPAAKTRHQQQKPGGQRDADGAARPQQQPGSDSRLTRNARAHKTHVNTHTHTHVALNALGATAVAAAAGLIGGLFWLVHAPRLCIAYLCSTACLADFCCCCCCLPAADAHVLRPWLRITSPDGARGRVCGRCRTAFTHLHTSRVLASARWRRSDRAQLETITILKSH